MQTLAITSWHQAGFEARELSRNLNAKSESAQTQTL